MKRMMCASVFSALLLLACNKKEPQAVERAGAVAQEPPMGCGKEMITDQPVKVGETGVQLPVGTRFCITADNREVRVQLPEGFAFLSKDEKVTERTLPVFATYACYCSKEGSACNVFFAEGLGFGCLHSSCTGACTGRFTYKGYSLDRVINLGDKGSFFNAPEVQQQIRFVTKDVSPPESYGKFSVMGISFFLVQDEKAFLAQATCDCEGTRACKLKSMTLPLQKGETQKRKIYYCEGACNGCELTVKELR